MVEEGLEDGGVVGSRTEEEDGTSIELRNSVGDDICDRRTSPTGAFHWVTLTSRTATRSMLTANVDVGQRKLFLPLLTQISLKEVTTLKMRILLMEIYLTHSRMKKATCRLHFSQKSIMTTLTTPVLSLRHV